MTTRSGVTFEADAVALTVSIGVLNSDLIKYQPELPQWKREVLSHCTNGVYTKVFMEFE